MDITKLVAIVLIVVGAFGLAYGGFSFTKETHTADLGPVTLSIDEKQYVSVPIWAGLGSILVGGLLLVVGRKS